MVRSGRAPALFPIEVAEAAILGNLALVCQLIGWVFAPLASLQWASALFFGVLALRRRRRAVVFSGLAVGAIGFIVGGVVLSAQIYLAAVIGYATAKSLGRKARLIRVLLSVLVYGAVPVDITTVALLAIFARARQILLSQVLAGWAGLGNAVAGAGHVLLRLGRSAGTGPVASYLSHAGHLLVRTGHGFAHPARFFVTHWWVTIPSLNTLGILFITFLSALALSPLLRAVAREQAGRVEPLFYRLWAAEEGDVAPLPVHLKGVTFSYGGPPVVSGVSLSVEAGDFVGIVGPNGSGKSTLAAVIAGLPPTEGVCERPGSAGIGKEGGTSVVMQRPESQVLGARVIDDVVFGLPEPSYSEAERVLSQVGMAHLKDKETFGLSGGQLQRLAVAAALMRRPSLLISDESTAMLDEEGRRSVTELLGELADAGRAVVHVTHLPEEQGRFSKTVALGRDADAPEPRLEPFLFSRPHSLGERLLELRGVGHVWSAGTPWASRALEGLDLDLFAGRLVLVVGENGAGKSTLGLVASGALVPTEGYVNFLASQGGQDGHDNEQGDGGWGYLVFQHPMLQMTRRKVWDNLAFSGSRVDGFKAYSALASVGLSPERFRDRAVETLSGGELRRLAVAMALLSPASVLVLDEPLAGLDAPSRSGMKTLLAQLKSLNFALMVITHDLAPLSGLADETIVLEGGRVTERL